MKNKIQDLNNHLFAQLERLSDEDAKPDTIEREIKRAEAVGGISEQIIKAADLRIRAAKLYADHGHIVEKMLPEIGGKQEPPKS